MKVKKVPTIGQLLSAMPKTGVTTVNDRLLAYATLGYHYDGVDRRVGHSVRKLRAFITELDAWTGDTVGSFESTQVDDEDNDMFGCLLKFKDQSYDIQFTSPTLANMPKPNDDQAAFIREGIQKLAADPQVVFDLPYVCFPVVSEALGRALGFL